MTKIQLTPETYPRISIITPSYNQGQFLEETILSVFNQDYPNLEYFVIDGGSTDKSVEIIQRYASRLTYWESKPDRGQSQAINKGFNMATGELVAWINSDDVLCPGALNQIAFVWKEDPSVGFIHGKSELIDENGVAMNKSHGGHFDMIDSLTTSKNPVAQPSTFISLKCLKAVGFLDKRLHMSMDWDLWLRLGARFSNKFIPDVLSQTRHWSMTKTNTQLIKSGSEHITIARKLIKDNTLRLRKEDQSKTLAAAYGKKAYIAYQSHKIIQSKFALFVSLLYHPKSKGGEAMKIRKQVFPIYFFICEKSSSLWECIKLKL